MKTDLEIFVENMKHIRKAKGYSQAKLAEIANISTGLVGELESFHTNPNINTLSAISHALEIPLSQMFQESIDNKSSRLLSKEEKKEIIIDLMKDL